MTDINLQRKSSSSAMWWVLGIIALLVVLWMLWAWTGDRTGTVWLAPAGDHPQAALVESGFLPYA